MVNGIRTISPHELNKGFSLNFCEGSRIQQDTPVEGPRTKQLKHCEYNNKDEDNSLNTLNDKKLSSLFNYFFQIGSMKNSDRT